MLTRIILFALIVGLVYLNYTTPKIEAHKAVLIAELQQSGYPVSESMREQIWREVDYSNFMVCSFMKTKEDSKMITSGYLNKVKLVNSKWTDEIKAKLQSQAQSY